MLNVLIVDDSLFMRKKLRSIIEKFDICEIREAEDGREAISQYESFRPDLVTLDITMPGMNGIDVFRQLKKLDPGVNVIMISALGQENLIKESILLGAFTFIIKPFTNENVERSIAEFIHFYQRDFASEK